MVSYYRDHYGGERHKKGQIINANVNRVALKRLINLSSIRNLLDVGTGYGFLLSVLQSLEGLSCRGVELSEQQAGFAVDELGLDVCAKTLDQANIEHESFDLVTCFEVLEHIPSPLPFVKELADHVCPGGKLVIMTDNFDSRVSRFLGSDFPKWIPHSHVSFFSPHSLRSLVDRIPCLRLISFLSYTPWELLVRSLFRSSSASMMPQTLCDIEKEMHGAYRLFWMRRLINKLWFRFTASNKVDGAIMFALLEKKCR
ncbi:class I SAM-dependent methyltransferase [Verrucomicrobiota bacterium]